MQSQRVKRNRLPVSTVVKAAPEVPAPKIKKRNQQFADKTSSSQGRLKGRARIRAREKNQPSSLIGTGSDTRLARQTVQDLAVPNQQPAITIQVPLDAITLYGVCIQYVSLALSRGYMARAPSANYPYWASVYMVNVLLAFVKGTTPQAQTLPHWLQCFGQALAPKTVPCGSGRAFYSFAVSAPNPYVPAPAVTIGSSVYAYEHNLYVQGGAGPDGFPVALPPAAYSADNGALAWSSLAQFMELTEKPHTKVIPLTTTPWAKNVSAFAMPANPEGLGFNNCGGQAIQAGLEVPIHTPILSAFAGYLIDGAVNPARYALFTNTTATDSLFVGACFAQLAPWKALGMKKLPAFHALDFQEIAEVLAMWVGIIQSNAAKDAGFMAAVQDPLALQCPLSLQEVMLLFKNEVMYSWNRSQVAVQSLYPRSPNVPTDNEFVPYICSSSTVALSSSGMLLPDGIIENINSNQSRFVVPEGGTVKDSEFFCPILGQYASDVLTPSNYQYQVYTDGVPANYNSFATLASHTLRRRRNSKGAADTWDPEVEVAISLIDGTSGPNYTFTNDPTRLTELSALWNEWLNRFKTYSMHCGTVNRELGVNICSSVGMTRHWIEITDERKKMNLEFRDIRLESKRHLSATHYAQRQQTAISSHDKLISAPFDGILKWWWLPINHATNTSNAAFSIFQRQQIISRETFSSGTASETAGQTLAELHSLYANMMAKGPLAPATAMEEFFLQMAKDGHGGVLSGLVAGFLGKAFGPTVGSIAGSVAEIIPI